MRGNEFVFSTPFFHLFCHLHERTSGQIPFKPKWPNPKLYFSCQKGVCDNNQSPGQDGIRELVLGWTCTIERHLVLRRYVLMAEWLCISHASMIFFYVVLMNVWHSYHLLLNGEHSSKVHRAKKSDQWEESCSSDGARRKYGGLQCIHRQNIITSIIAESVFHNDIFFRFFLEEIMRYYSTLHGI